VNAVITNAVIQAYRFALDPTPAQDAVLRFGIAGAAVRVQLGPGAGEAGDGAADGGKRPTASEKRS